MVILNDNIPILLSNACHRILSLSENEVLRKETLTNYPLTQYITPSQVCSLIDLNQFLALDIMPFLLSSDHAKL
jgi:hypothetical protein